MNMDERIKRINELYHKSKSVGLSDAEKEEQARLRKEYVASIRGNLKSQLESMTIQYEDGSRERVSDRKKRIEGEKHLELIGEKKKLRKSILEKRDSLSEEEQKRAQVLITERILGHQWFYLSENILCFASYGSEIRTNEILKEALQKGKKVYLPKIVGPDKMSFYRVDDLEQLKVGYHGIKEPDEAAEEYVYDEETAKKTLLIMPGVAFDVYGNRLGYGKGFYDRYLEDKKGLWVRSIGIGHACQKVDKIETDEKDVKPYQVILV